MTYFGESKTPFEETMDPPAGFFGHETTLPPYEPTLGDYHDTHPDEEATTVVPPSKIARQVVAEQVELDKGSPEDN